MARRRLLATLVGVATTMTVATSGAHGGTAPDDTALTGPLAAEMTAALAQQPGGVQVSDNAMVWDDGAVVVVWPSPGDAAAPLGLGDGVRADVLAGLGLSAAGLGGEVPADRLGGTSDRISPRGTHTSCPVDYYCFYTSMNWDGARYQFSSTCSGSAASYGFDNNTSSWANRNLDKRINAYDTSGGTLLWTMGAGRTSAYVGTANDNRMSAWTCTFV